LSSKKKTGPAVFEGRQTILGRPGLFLRGPKGLCKRPPPPKRAEIPSRGFFFQYNAPAPWWWRDCLWPGGRHRGFDFQNPPKPGSGFFQKAFCGRKGGNFDGRETDPRAPGPHQRGPWSLGKPGVIRWLLFRGAAAVPSKFLAASPFFFFFFQNLFFFGLFFGGGKGGKNPDFGRPSQKQRIIWRALPPKIPTPVNGPRGPWGPGGKKNVARAPAGGAMGPGARGPRQLGAGKGPGGTRFRRPGRGLVGPTPKKTPGGGGPKGAGGGKGGFFRFWALLMAPAPAIVARYPSDGPKISPPWFWLGAPPRIGKNGPSGLESGLFSGGAPSSPPKPLCRGPGHPFGQNAPACRAAPIRVRASCASFAFSKPGGAPVAGV